jgi:hypothetical protein
MEPMTPKPWNSPVKIFACISVLLFSLWSYKTMIKVPKFHGKCSEKNIFPIQRKEV